MLRADRSLPLLLRLGLMAMIVTACATSDQFGPSATFTTMSPGWESKFSLVWHVTEKPDGSRLLWGEITSHYGQYADPFRLLGQALDSSGNVVSQSVQRVPGGVPGFSSTYYEVAGLAAADHYKVTVWSYSFVEERGQLQ
jgi:hypothetical protein